MGGGAAMIPFNYSSTLGCGMCILGNYTFCISAPEGFQIQSSSSPPQMKCCKSASETDCPEASNSTWNCSNVYSNPGFAKVMCP